ncbi:chaoptin [Lingula anatina]|uniref:Chaoptin n=1 Tax=Lingula anatina TaxID=7574 RepID=A0A1S3K3K3_LINAN|nr:chaoptin [Lingula anatina]XP_013417206.1 chaoptin [Lingula anatina]XP_013417213.1 chaoptin [Lingula anatina]XP_013417220.1 chaoptin [Lingula anatina]XP_013417228.1 chaoptin [Lingula anatina]XP_013417235.1 chaoptin [Lingula anatina]|eukprot:XP_013417198.1 chaoptin [Lingula anatina]
MNKIMQIQFLTTEPHASSMWRHVILLFYLTTLLSNTATASKCPVPEPCVCQKRVTDKGVEAWVINCQRKRISPFVPQLQLTSNNVVDVLDLSHNIITHVRNSPFMGLQLQKLDLSYNIELTLSGSAFTGLEDYIEEISIDHCGIQEIPQRTFQNLRKLQRLSMSYNCFHTISGNAFINTNLTLLSMTKNCIDTIDPLAFVSLENSLEHLYLSNNGIKLMPFGALSRLNNIKVLDLSGNKIKGVYFKQNLTHAGLKSLVSLSLDGNQITAIFVGTFQLLESLQHLNLDHNKITSISPMAFHGPRQLKHIYLHNNQIRTLPTTAFYGTETSLQHLSLGKNLLDCKVFDSLESLEVLQSLHLQSNLIDRVPKDGMGRYDKIVMTLNLANNKLDKLPRRFLATFKQLKELDLSQNNMSSIVFEPPGEHSYQLIKLKLTGMGLKALPAGLVHLVNLQELYVAHNLLASIPQSLWTSLSKLRKLDLSDNIFEQIPVEFLQNHQLLSEIKMSNNKLRAVPAYVFKNQSQLKTLALKGNEIQLLEPRSFYGLENSLTSLDINHNNLKQLPQCIFERLSKLSVFSYSHNPLQCDCGLAWLVAYPDTRARCVTQVGGRNRVRKVSSFIVHRCKYSDNASRCNSTTTTIMQSATVSPSKTFDTGPWKGFSLAPEEKSEQRREPNYPHKDASTVYLASPGAIVDSSKLSLQVLPHSSYSHLSWKVHGAYLAETQGYKITYRLFGEKEVRGYLLDGNTITQYNITGLTPGHHYLVCVTTRTRKPPSYHACEEVVTGSGSYGSLSGLAHHRYTFLYMCIALVVVCVALTAVLMVMCCKWRRKKKKDVLTKV